jgi:hypothetical protein
MVRHGFLLLPDAFRAGTKRHFNRRLMLYSTTSEFCIAFLLGSRKMLRFTQNSSSRFLHRCLNLSENRQIQAALIAILRLRNLRRFDLSSAECSKSPSAGHL